MSKGLERKSEHYSYPEFFIVWVGGVPDYEGNSLKVAESVRDKWLGLGHDDVILEIIYC